MASVFILINIVLQKFYFNFQITRYVYMFYMHNFLTVVAYFYFIFCAQIDIMDTRSESALKAIAQREIIVFGFSNFHHNFMPVSTA